MRVREIKKSYISCVGYLPSVKNKRQIAFESTVERDYYMILEFDDNVISYEEQSLRIYYTYKDGFRTRYTTDCLVTYQDNTQKYFEVKKAEQIRNDNDLKEHIDFLIIYFPKNIGIPLELITDEDMNNIYLDNLKFLYNFAFLPKNKEKYSHIDCAVKNLKDSTTIEQLLNHLSQNKFEQLYYLPYVWNYLFNNKHLINLYEKLTNITLIIKERSDSWVK